MISRIIILTFFLLSCINGKIFAVDAPYFFVKNYTIEDYNASCQNWGLALTPEGLLYVANNSGLLCFDGNSWSLNVPSDESSMIGVTYYRDTIYTLSTNGIGCWNKDEFGLLKYQYLKKIPQEVNFKSPEIILPFSLPEEISKAEPSSICENDKYYFVGTLTDGLFILSKSGNILSHLSLDNQLQDNIVRAITLQDNKTLWLALDNGITQIMLNPPLYVLEKRSAIGKLENGMIMDSILYIQTNQGQYSGSLTSHIYFKPLKDDTLKFPYLKSDTIRIESIFTNKESLGFFSNATQVYPVSNHLYWLLLGNEAALFHADKGIGTLVCRLLFDNYDINLITRGRRIFPLNEDFLLLSAMQGCYMVNIRDLISGGIKQATPLYISKIYYTNKEETHYLPINNYDITLPHNFQQFSIYVGTTIFTSNHQISYMIEGVSDTWSPWQQEGKITFLQLPEGTYKLKIRKYVVRGPFPELTISIKVEVPWYNSIAAWVLYLFILWVIIKLILKFGLHNLQKEEQNKIEADKQEEEKRLVEMRQKMLEIEIQNKNKELTLQTSEILKRNQIMQRLIEELDNQKETLGDRYPNKLYNKMKALMEEPLNDQANWIQFESYFNSTHQNFLERLRQKYSDLTTGDLRLCCLLRMNLSTKEIASLLNISIRAIELRRYRMRKRMELEGDTNLVDFLMNF